MLTALVGNNTYLKQTTSNSLSTGMNGGWVSCRSALCMIDFNHLRMSTSHSSQLGHFVVLPSRHVSAGESPHSSTGGDLRSPSPVLIPILLPPLAEEFSPFAQLCHLFLLTQGSICSRLQSLMLIPQGPWRCGERGGVRALVCPCLEDGEGSRAGPGGVQRWTWQSVMGLPGVPLDPPCTSEKLVQPLSISAGWFQAGSRWHWPVLDLPGAACP